MVITNTTSLPLPIVCNISRTFCNMFHFANYKRFYAVKPLIIKIILLNSTKASNHDTHKDTLLQPLNALKLVKMHR